MKRLQFDIPEERVKQLDGLVTRSGLKTRAQLFNSALTLFEWAIRERTSGRIIASVDEKVGKYKEVEMPGFPAIPDYQEQERAQESESEKEFEHLIMETAQRVDSPDQAALLRNLARALSKDLDANAIALQLNQVPLSSLQRQAKATNAPVKARAGRFAPTKKETGGAKVYSVRKAGGNRKGPQRSKKGSGSQTFGKLEVEE